MPNPWDKYSAQPVGPILGAPKPVDPFRAEDQQMERNRDARAAENADRQNRTSIRGIEVQERAADKQGYDSTMKLRGDYDALPAVKEYRIAVSQLAAGLKATPDATGDNALIYSYAKAMDPGSVVRESEMSMAASGASVIEASAAKLKKEFGIEGGGLLDPSVREALRREMLHKVTAIKAGYDSQRQRFIADANAFGIDPARVIGNHDGDPFDAEFRAYDDKRRGGQPGAEPIPPVEQMSDEAFGRSLNEIFSDKSKTQEQRVAAALMLAQKAGRGVDPAQVEAGAEFGGGRLNVDPNFVPPQSIPAQLGEATGNVVTGLAQGGAALIDIPTQAVGGVMAPVADALGFDNAAAAWRNPTTIGGLIEKAVPTPQDGVGRGVRFAGQLAGGAASFPGRAANALTNAIVGRVPGLPLARGGAAVMAAARRQGVDLLPADVGGDAVKAFTSGAAQTPFSRGSVVGTSRRAAVQMDNATGRAAAGEGDVLPIDEAGEAVRRGGKQFIANATERASRFYERAGAMAQGVKVMPERDIQAIDEHIARKSQAGEMADDVVGELEKVKRSLAQTGGITVTGLREARTILGSMARGDKLRGTDAKRIFGEVLDAASDDMATSLAAAGKEGASRLFRRADTLWRDRILEIDEVLEPVIGKGKSGEDVLRAVEGMAQGGRGGVARLQRMLAALPANEKGDVTATVIDRLGRASASAQDDTGSVFSSETFLTNWNKMPGKGKAALFGNSETRRNLNDIALLASARRGTAQLASKSNTPVGMSGNVAALAGLGYAVTPVGAFAIGAMQYGTGRLLASPAFTRWLARTPKNPAAFPGHIRKLKAVAASNGAIADDIASVQQRLAEAFAQSPGRAAAEQEQ